MKRLIVVSMIMAVVLTGCGKGEGTVSTDSGFIKEAVVREATVDEVEVEEIIFEEIEVKEIEVKPAF